MQKVRELQAERGTAIAPIGAEMLLRQSGRLDFSATAVATSSQNPDVKVRIDDLTNRIAMLGDVQGRVPLMKRDLSVLITSYTKDF
jgi:hypothetical protein